MFKVLCLVILLIATSGCLVTTLDNTPLLPRVNACESEERENRDIEQARRDYEKSQEVNKVAIKN